MMKKKNGFISISVIYSFFVVFMLILIIIINSYINNRASFDIYKDYVKENMAGKYVVTEGNTKKLNEEIIKYYDNYKMTVWGTFDDMRTWYVDKINIGGEDNYYFRGTNPPNFVCLSTNPKDDCQENTSALFRIVGVFSPKVHKAIDEEYKNEYLVKLVKFSPYTTETYKTTIDLLSQYVDDSFDTKIMKMIAQTRWSIFESDNASIEFKTMRDNELSMADSDTSWVGLLTVSDIGYTTGEFTEPSTINCKPSLLTADTLNGIYNGFNTGCHSYGWNISEQWLYNPTFNDEEGFKIDSSGNIVIDDGTSRLSMRPVIYLKPDAVILKGTGSQDNPYVLNIYTAEDTSE